MGATTIMLPATPIYQPPFDCYCRKFHSPEGCFTNGKTPEEGNRENQRQEELAHVATANFARQRREPEIDLARCVNQLTRVSPLLCLLTPFVESRRCSACRREGRSRRRGG
nr:hypothetical protein Iba_scaffold17844CG0150 [Ipomoea batatas]